MVFGENGVKDCLKTGMKEMVDESSALAESGKHDYYHTRAIS